MTAWNISERAAALHREALVWDNTFPFGPVCGSREAHLNSLVRMADSGYDCVNLTIASDNENMAAAVEAISSARAHFHANADRYVLVDGAADVEAAKASGRMAIVFGFQGTLPFERDTGLVEVFYRLGVRQALMAYNQKNNVGDGCHERTDAGLSRFGVEVVQAMEQVGMLVDCTHTGYRTTMDVFEVATRPVIFSHSNSRALVDHERNIADEQAKACAATGGVVGVNGIGIFLGPNDTSTEALFRHLDHWVQLVGPAHVGIGLDFVSELDALNGFVRRKASKYPAGQSYDVEVRVVDPEQIPVLTEQMVSHGYADDDVRGILGGNWLRVAREVWS
ncbi:MAG: membrane dipeptidase [Hyphomicrobiales bacterium]|nr:membrane dipeptidase [Hyphomicrobiales bacterium]MCP5373333.1 membrane dipeptidase [Hyphomicrobiales bacterium]